MREGREARTTPPLGWQIRPLRHEMGLGARSMALAPQNALTGVSRRYVATPLLSPKCKPSFPAPCPIGLPLSFFPTARFCSWGLGSGCGACRLLFPSALPPPPLKNRSCSLGLFALPAWAAMAGQPLLLSLLSVFCLLRPFCKSWGNRPTIKKSCER